ncbi:MAG: flagellar biosynthesis protein FlhB [Deltaproteobacteria bacterium]|nr:flagellar biosynthesis protein FlhB [Deltaproteobacteria bacterium]
MADNSFQEKTEQATPKKRADARKKGQIAKSREISSVAILSAGTIYMFFNAGSITIDLGEYIKRTFSAIPLFIASDHNYIALISREIEHFLWVVMPFMLIIAIIAVLANILQSGFILSVEPLTPKLSKIDPITGAGKILSKRSLAELAKSVLKITVIGWVVYYTLKADSHYILPLLYHDNSQILFILGRISLKVVLRCCGAILILAILDFIYQKWDFEQNLKMTKQEVKDEYKQTEGDPLIKSRIKSIQREMARRRMMEEVPKADVIITNPTHLFLALRYAPGENMTAPRLVAKGANRLAFRIRELAREHGVPMVENKILAQNLYKLDLGDEIPPQFYKTVAEILAYVYGLKKKRLNRG